ncbi:MAG: gamma-glutamylcyclotransferase [Acidobacteria bacterium]|nr:gamma-glutamylcyclotransferase [Acidobacteriota bacterium]
MSSSTAKELLFSYGTLQRKDIQIATFGRELDGREDALSGYALASVPIHDPEAAAAIGETHYSNAEPSSNPGDEISGTVYAITEQELVAADKYEEDAGYRRISVELKSGITAWLYMRS